MLDTIPLNRTLADVIAELERDTSLSPTRQRDLKSALRRLCTLIDRPPSRVPASISELRGAINGLNPVQARISAKTMQNLRANVLAALRRSATQEPERTTLSRSWQDLYGRLPDKRFKSGLSRFMRFCSANNVAPEAVDDMVVSNFVVWLDEATLVPKPHELHRRTCRLWNDAVETIPGWPFQRLSVPDYREPRRSIPLSALPLPFQHEVARYLDWLADPDPFDDERPRRALKARTLALRRKLIELAASAWVLRGHDREQLRSLADLIDERAAKEVLRFYLAQNRPASPTFLCSLAQLLFSIAKEWVRVNETHLQSLRNIRRQLPPVPTGMTDKNRRTLRQFEDPEALHRLLLLPQQLIAEAGQCGTLRERTAIKAQLAVAIELLLLAPIRMSNLITLRIGHELIRPTGGTAGYRLAIGPSETKNTEPIDFALPPHLTELIDAYLQEFRMLLTGHTNPYLFPARTQGHKAQSTFSQQIQEMLVERLGFRMTPHQFRHFSAWFYLRNRPGDFVTVQKLLGHKNIKTTINFYAKLDTLTAGQHYDEIIANVRESLGREPNLRRRSRRP